MDAIETQLQAMGITLPDAPAAAANYVPFQLCGEYLYISGQLPMKDGKIVYVGTLGAEPAGTGAPGQGIDVEDGIAAARLCAINILAQVKSALGDFDRVTRCVRLGGFVNSTNSFTDHPKIINGASDLIAEVLGKHGRHTRIAVGASSLPFGAAVEIEALFQFYIDDE